VASAAIALCRALRQWREDVRRVAASAESALRECEFAAARVAEAAQICRRGLLGFEALAEGGRALGESAARAAMAASHFIDGWILSVLGPSDPETERDGSP
jgi:hypothetical protein